MKQILALILTVLLLCETLTPSVLAAEEPSPSAETETTDIVTDSGNGANTDFTQLHNALDSYGISGLRLKQEAQKSVQPLLPVLGGLILAAGGITFFRRRRHG